MAKLKNQPTQNDVRAFLEKYPDDQRRKDALTVLNMMETITGEPPVLWGQDRIGFGRYRYTYKSGRSGEWFMIGLSPRKAQLSIYLLCGHEPLHDLLNKLGKHTLGKSCLYIKNLDDVDLEVLHKIISTAWTMMKQRYA